MIIHDIFEHDIERPINGVVKVADTEEKLVEQELREYVVAKELQGHFEEFYRNYGSSIDAPTGKMGVWISGFFGSGKSHFLKMLSYLLSNPVVAGKRAVDYFEDKIANPLVYAEMRRVADVPTETILFNVDSKGGMWKEGETAKTALLRSFERVFYEHLGFCGENLKLAKLEQFIESRGKTSEFRAAFEEGTGLSWVENRAGFAFYEDDMVETMQRVLGMSREAAQHWFDGTETDVISSDTFAGQIAEYVETRAAELGDFRLLFMADEIGQFIADDSDLALSMQTLCEDIGTRCSGRVWVVVTSQQSIDALDKMTKEQEDTFSKIQGRFDTRLSLSSSDVDEVIKERVLAKTDEAASLLESKYEKQATVLKNLFTFDGPTTTSDIGGYSSAREFVESYPFVGYQFKVLPSVFTATREHGFSGKHMSSGERSMLSAFKESAERVQNEQTGALVPFWRFYDTIETSLDYGIRNVISRAQEAADAERGLIPFDVQVLKALYLIRYITDIHASVNNISNLMIDTMDVDKIALRAQVQASLERLVRENKAARNGERYNFLTNEEQDVAREIAAVQVDSSEVVDKIKKILFDGIYTATKHRKGQNDFPFDKYVDDSVHGKDSGGMKLNVITYAHEWSRLSEGEFALKSVNQALVGLAEGEYYELLDMACRVDKYYRMGGSSQWSASKQDIARKKRDEARSNEKAAKAALEAAISHARLAANGRSVTVHESAPAKRIDAVLDELVAGVYTKADLVDAPVSNDADLAGILRGELHGDPLPGEPAPNERACDEVMLFMDAQAWGHQATNMGEIQRKYQKAPYGWREIDVAAVVAQLLNRQRVAMSVGGRQLGKDDEHEIVEHLRRNVDSAAVKKREAIDAGVLASVQRLMKDFAGTSQVPADEDGLFAFSKRKLEEMRDACKTLQDKWYSRAAYPGKETVTAGKKISGDLLANAVDPYVFLKALSARTTQDELLDLSEDLERVRGFFTTQVRLFDASAEIVDSLATEGIYIEGDAEAQGALGEIRAILSMAEPYGRIKDLNALNGVVERALRSAASAKRDDLLRSIDDALEQVERYAADEAGEHASVVAPVLSSASQAAIAKRDSAHATESCSQLDAQISQLKTWQGQQFKKVDNAIAAARAAEEAARKGQAGGGAAPPVPDKPKVSIRDLKRSRVCPTKTLRTSEEIDAYVESIRQKLLDALEGNDGVRLGD